MRARDKQTGCDPIRIAVCPIAVCPIKHSCVVRPQYRVRDLDLDLDYVLRFDVCEDDAGGVCAADDDDVREATGDDER